MAAATADWEGSVGIDADVFQLRQGDLEALSALIARYQNRLYRYLLRMVRQPQEAEDLFQQTWLRVAEKIRSYDPQRNFDAWLFTLARHLAVDFLRRKRPHSLDEPAGEYDAGETLASRLASADQAVLETLLARERSLHLAAALDELPVVYREVLTLRFEEEMKLEEIALVLAAPLSTVKSRLRRGLEQMRAILETRGSAEVWQ
ncbi:MAG TPA: sigma-70 family RNA polymerase sigma factor [Candidatus Acidoferrales bacterium]